MSEDGFAADIVRAADRSGVTPLDYMLSVLRDPNADPSRRDRMAVACAPYVHARVADSRIGKKEIAREEARHASAAWMAALGERDDRSQQ